MIMTKAKTPAEKTKKPAAKPAEEFATKAEVKDLTSAVEKLLEMVSAQATAAQEKAAAVAETPIEREVRKAAPDQMPVNPAWKEKAEEILGEMMDHCEVLYPRGGGAIFTVVVAEKHSNAAIEYLEMNKTDRRSREIGNEGIEGVENWCKLIKSNLARKR